MSRRSRLGVLHDVFPIMASIGKEYNSFAVAVWQADSGSDVCNFFVYGVLAGYKAPSFFLRHLFCRWFDRFLLVQ